MSGVGLPEVNLSRSELSRIGPSRVGVVSDKLFWVGLSVVWLIRVAWIGFLSTMALIALAWVTLGDKSKIINRFVSGRVLVRMGEGGWVGVS